MMLANRVRELTTTSGTGDITLGGALAGHVRFQDAFAVGDAVSYVIEDGDDYEIGTGTMQDADTLARTSVLETLVDGVLDRGAPEAISLSGNARVFCAATAEFLTRAEIGTTTDESFKLKANDTVYLSLDPSGDIRATGRLIADAGAKIGLQNGVDGGSGQGIFLRDTGDSNWGIYMASSASGSSLSDGTPCASLDGRTNYLLRNRVPALPVNAFAWENSAEQCLMSLTADTGDLYTLGHAVVGGSVFSEDLLRTGDSDRLIVSGGATTTSAANIVLYGSSHATNANDILLRAGGITRLWWDNSADRWHFHNNTLSGVRYLLRGLSNDAFLVSGGEGTSLGANLALFGDTHATNAGDVRFRTNTTTTLMYDHSAKVWDFNASNLLTQGRVNIGPTSFLPWHDAYDSLHIGSTGSIMAYGSGTNTYISDNAYYDGTNFKRIVEEGAATHRLFEGTHTFRVAASDMVGSNITWIDALSIAIDGEITAAGNLIAGGVVKGLAEATGNRPSAASVGAGATMFDTTLNKPIWSDGSQWVDAAGAAA